MTRSEEIAADRTLADLLREVRIKSIMHRIDSEILATHAPKAPDLTVHPAEEWCEEDGDVLWWRFPIVEPPHLGSPLDTDWEDGLYTHWTRIVVPEESSWPKWPEPNG